MIYAQINDNMVINTVDIEDISLIPLFSEGYDLFLQIDNLSPIPSTSWTYNPVTCSFSPPLTLPESVAVTSMACGNQIILQWNASNFQQQIYAAGQTIAFLAYVTQLYQFLSLGYLNDANDTIVVMIADTSPTKTGLAPFLTDDILENFQLQIQACLNNLPSLD